MFYVFLFFSATLTALSNFFIRRSIDSENSSGDPYLVYRLFFSALIMAAASLAAKGYIALDKRMLILGAGAGVLLGCLMWLLGKSLKYGGGGITFAAVNSACMLPPLAMAFFFGSGFEHSYTLSDAVGAVFMATGLFLSARGERKDILRPWYYWIFLTFLVHAVYLTYFQWRALILKGDLPASPFIPFRCDAHTADCFGIAMFVIATLMQFLLPAPPSEKKTSYRPLVKFGIGGGLINGLSALSLLKATETAYAIQKSILFPAQAASVILLCSLWGQLFYKEHIFWPGILLCALGVMISFV